MEKYDGFWLKLQTANPEKNIVKVRRLTEGVAQIISNACQKGGIRSDELLIGLSLGIVTSFEAISPKNRKEIVKEFCGSLHNVSEALEPGENEDTNN